METNSTAGPSPSSDTRQGRSEKRAFPRKRVSVWGLGPALRPKRCHVRPLGRHQHMAPHLLTGPPHAPGGTSTGLPVLISYLFAQVSPLLQLVTFSRARPAFCVFLSERDPSLREARLASLGSQLITGAALFLFEAARPRG